jgi:hypothetical protein
LRLRQGLSAAHRCGCEGGGQIFGASSLNLVQDRVARGIHHFITSSGQRARENVVEGSSETIIGTEGGRIGLAAARLFGAFHRLEAVLAFFLGTFAIRANALQGGAFRPGWLQRAVKSRQTWESTRLLGRPYPHYYHHREWSQARRCPRDSVVLPPDKGVSHANPRLPRR